jgi:hypothetical protein
VAGATQINLNAAEAVDDADVSIVGLPIVVIEGQAGSPVRRGRSGTGAMSLRGSTGN